MKADPSIQRLLLDVADLDTRLAQTRHRARGLPEEAELTALNSQLEELRAAQIRAEIATEDTTREVRRLEAEMTRIADRVGKDARQLTDGAQSSKALSELQHEVSSLTRRQGILEDELLAVMEQQEATEIEVKRVSVAADEVAERIADVTIRRDRARADVADEEAALLRRREALAEDIDADLLTLYERIRATGRVGAGLLRARRCSACGIELDRGTLSRLSVLPAEQVARCDECDAILVRTGESGL